MTTTISTWKSSVTSAGAGTRTGSTGRGTLTLTPTPTPIAAPTPVVAQAQTSTSTGGGGGSGLMDTSDIDMLKDALGGTGVDLRKKNLSIIPPGPTATAKEGTVTRLRPHTLPRITTHPTKTERGNSRFDARNRILFSRYLEENENGADIPEVAIMDMASDAYGGGVETILAFTFNTLLKAVVMDAKNMLKIEEDISKIHRFIIDTDTKKSYIYKLKTNDIKPIPYVSSGDPKFHYKVIDLYGDGEHCAPPEAETLLPNLVQTPDPTPLSFPKAPIYIRSELNLRFRRGYVYSTSMIISEESKNIESQRLYKIATPPGVRPLSYNEQSKKYILGPVEGMIQMPAGVPFVVNIDGDLNKNITIACLQTLDSLKGYQEYSTIEQTFQEVVKLTWGDSDNLPIFCLDGTKLNHRSQPAKEDRYDGSVSLGITVEEVSDGYVQPAAQAVTNEAKAIQLALLTCLAKLYKLIMPLCISKQELDVKLFRDADVNALCCGSFLSGFSGVQRNTSSSTQGGDLVTSLNIDSGAWHTDFKDSIVGWTLLIAIFRLPPGMYS
ncbi:hypothetical protein EV361DRAFT_946645 [Lentinula raphanica]|nr:hypothetical protein EV361DRAFT_946645 [Lentinula raphanica]